MKNPTILEGGIARAFGSIKALFTRQLNSDDKIMWVPESDRQLTTKYITQNGVYKASDDGYYAYSSVTVNVPTDGGASGTGDDGEQHYVAPDPETGELVDTVMPSSIVVETPPTNQYGIYKDGQAIGKDGMVVKAYLANGELWTDESHPDGVVPNVEIALVPTNAIYDANTDAPTGTATYDGMTCIYTSPSFAYHSFGGTEIIKNNNTYGYASVQGNDNIFGVTQKVTSNSIRTLIISNTSFVGTYRGYSGEIKDLTVSQQDGYYYAYCGGAISIDGLYENPEWFPDITDLTIKQIGDCLFNGERTPPTYGSRQTITAEWPRVGDGAVLSDTFEILVAPPIYGGGEA